MVVVHAEQLTLSDLRRNIPGNECILPVRWPDHLPLPRLEELGGGGMECSAAAMLACAFGDWADTVASCTSVVRRSTRRPAVQPSWSGVEPRR
jgi:hypothetical protein